MVICDEVTENQYYVVLIFQGCHNKVPKTGWFNKINLFSHNSGGSKSEIKGLPGMVSSEASLLVL